MSARGSIAVVRTQGIIIMSVRAVAIMRRVPMGVIMIMMMMMLFYLPPPGT